MIIYEVNLTVDNSILQHYQEWLVAHIGEMLQYRGFKQAFVAKEKTDEILDNTTRLCVQYTLSSEQDLEHYLTNHAADMRAAAIKKFGNKFSARRRVLINTNTILTS